MRILFLHTNFPGQFKHICAHFGNLGHEVRFLCNTHYGRTVANVKKYTIKLAKPVKSENLNEDKNHAQDKPSTSEQYREAFLSFIKEGGYPML